MKEYKDLFSNLLQANGEQEVFNIIENNNLLQDQNNWCPYGGTKSNFSVFDNQQPNPVPALIEKITNSIDSILLKECKIKGIDPKSSQAPKSMNESINIFFGIKNGELGEMTKTDRRKLSENIQLIATGEEKTPDILIFDNGEGQHPDNFPNSFLSIGKSNKNNIHFVQGQFNMGSTGAVVFCGEHRYQLIASRQNSKIFSLKKQDSKNPIGFTLVRRHVLDEKENDQYKNSWYEYFAIDGKVPSCEAEKIDLGLYNHFKCGAIVKLFSYQLPRGCGGTIRDGLYHELNQSLYKPALPFLLIDKRPKYSKFDDLTVSGNYIRLSDSKDNILEREPFYMKINDKDIGVVEIRAFLLKKGEDPKQQSNRKSRFIGKKSVIFTINGQVHGFYGSSKIKEWGFTYLKDSLLVQVDCTAIKINFRQDLFMANRYSFKETQKLEKLLEEIKKTLKSNTNLKEANNERKNQLLSKGDNQDELNMIRSILSKNPAKEELIKLLNTHGELFKNKTKNGSSNSRSKADNIEKKLKSKRFPSIFKVNLSEKNEEKIKSIPLGGKGIIEFETDVQNDYLQRPDQQGELVLEILGYNSNSSQHQDSKISPNSSQHQDSKISPNKVEDFFNTTISGPDDHSIKIIFEPNQQLKIGDKLKLNARLSSPEGDIETLFYIKIRNKGKEKIEKNRTSNNFNPPPVIKISKKNDKWVQDNGQDWTEEGWEDDSVIHIMTSGNKVDAIAINMDSNIIKKYISRKAKDDKSLEVLKNKYISQIYLHALFLFNSMNKSIKKDNGDSAEELIAKIFKSYGEALIYLDHNEEILKMVS